MSNAVKYLPMKTGKTLFSLLAILVVLTSMSCSPKIPFTQAIREQYKLTPDEMKGIQFYLSDPVTLQRAEADASEKTTESGTLVIKSGNSMEEILFKANTPGALQSAVDDHKVTINFEEGSDRYLVFGSDGNRDGYYHLQALRWENGKGRVKYSGQYYTTNRGSDNSVLLFKMKSLKHLRVSEKVAKGVKVH